MSKKYQYTESEEESLKELFSSFPPKPKMECYVCGRAKTHEGSHLRISDGNHICYSCVNYMKSKVLTQTNEEK